jgi:hypothetical protein
VQRATELSWRSLDGRRFFQIVIAIFKAHTLQGRARKREWHFVVRIMLGVRLLHVIPQLYCIFV